MNNFIFKFLELTSIVMMIIFPESLGYSRNIMNQNSEFNFRGLLAPVFTPFNNDADRTLNLAIIPEYAEFLASKNITGILVGGTTGEGTSLSISERKKLVEAWAKATKETKQHLMIQIGGAALVDVRELAAHAESLEVNSLLCLPDLYFKPSKVDELIDYMANVGKSAPKTPLLYYQSTKASNNVKAGDFLKFASDKVPTLAGVKLDSSDIKEGYEAIKANDRFTVIYGSKMILSAGCTIGVESFMYATLNFVPELSSKLLEFCHGRMDLKSAQQIQNSIYNIEKEILQNGGYVETMKTAMSLITNLFMGPPRAPLKILSKQNVEAMISGLSKLGLKTNKSALKMY